MDRRRHNKWRLRGRPDDGSSAMAGSRWAHRVELSAFLPRYRLRWSHANANANTNTYVNATAPASHNHQFSGGSAKRSRSELAQHFRVDIRRESCSVLGYHSK